MFFLSDISVVCCQVGRQGPVTPVSPVTPVRCMMVPLGSVEGMYLIHVLEGVSCMVGVGPSPERAYILALTHLKIPHTLVG